MTTKLIAAFPGTGKSHFTSVAQSKLRVTDLDSNAYTLGYDAAGLALNPDFPDNYIADIQKHIGLNDVLLVSCQPEVLSRLQAVNLPFTLIYPKRELLPIYLKRFRQRGNPESFIHLMQETWDEFIAFLEQQSGCQHIVLDDNQYISDVLVR